MTDPTRATGEAARVDLDAIERALRDVRDNGLIGCKPGNEYVVLTETTFALVARVRSTEAALADATAHRDRLATTVRFADNLEKALRERVQSAEAERDAALARVKELEEVLRQVVEPWARETLNPSGAADAELMLRLHPILFRAARILASGAARLLAGKDGADG